MAGDRWPDRLLRAAGSRLGQLRRTAGKRPRRDGRALGGCDGQSTVEFAIVLFAFVAVAAGLAALWHLGGDGKLAQHALTSASHHLAGAVGAWAEVLAY